MPHWMKNKLFNGQRPNKETMLILFLSGILIFVILLPVDKSGSKNNGSYKNQNEVLAPQTSSTGKRLSTSWKTFCRGCRVLAK